MYAELTSTFVLLSAVVLSTTAVGSVESTPNNCAPVAEFWPTPAVLAYCVWQFRSLSQVVADEM